MKKITIVLLGVLLFTMSCTKEDLLNNNGLKSNLAYELSPIEANILEFINRMDLVRKNPRYKDSEEWNYSRDSAVWYLEAAINYKYSFIWKYPGNNELYGTYNIDSSYTTVNQNEEGIFNIVDLQTAYDALSESLESQYSKFEADSKFFVLSDIIEISTGNGSLELMQYSVIGKAYHNYFTTDWKWGLKAGDCLGNNIGLDATDIIEMKLIRIYAEGLVYLNIGTAQTNSNDGWIYPNCVPLPSGQSNPTPFYNYLLFNYETQGNHPCLTNSDMNWYRENILNIENSYKPDNKSIVYTDVDYVLTLSIPTYSLMHRINPFYGEPHFFIYPDPMD